MINWPETEVSKIASIVSIFILKIISAKTSWTVPLTGPCATPTGDDQQTAKSSYHFHH